MALGEIQCLVGTVDNIRWRIVGHQRAEPDADGDVANPTKDLFFDIGAEALKRRDSELLISWLQQGDEFLTAKTEQLVIEAEGLPHFLRQHNQHFIANQVAKVVVDLFEMVNVADGQPVVAAGRAAPATFWPVEHLVAGGFAEQLEKVLVEGLAAGQASQRVGFAVIKQALGLTPVERGVLLTDGYTAYEHYTKKTGLTHAQCWAHTRRKLFEAQDVEPTAARGLDFIGGLYAVEERIRTQKLSTARKLDYRLMHAKPIVEQFFAWINQQFEAQGLLPSNPLTKALAYARERRFGLEVYLTDPDVPIDTNHLERALRAIPMGPRPPPAGVPESGRPG